MFERTLENSKGFTGVTLFYLGGNMRVYSILNVVAVKLATMTQAAVRAAWISRADRGGRHRRSCMRAIPVFLAPFALASLAIGGASIASAATLTTPLAGGNENDGVMFDIQTGANALTLTSIGANIFGTANYEIYYKVGQINDSIASSGGGLIADPAGWTLLGSFNNVVGIGTVSADPGGIVEFDTVDLALAANSTYGLYITQTVPNAGMGSGIRFTNSVIGTTIASDGNLTIQNGRGAAYRFTAISRNGRNFNGSLTYTVNSAIPEPTTWGMMIFGLGMAGATLRRRGTVAASA